jgi:hypothetical protein
VQSNLLPQRLPGSTSRPDNLFFQGSGKSQEGIPSSDPGSRLTLSSRNIAMGGDLPHRPSWARAMLLRFAP